MKWRDLLADWGVTKLKLSAGFLDAEFEPTDDVRNAAWEMYIELATRVTTQALPDEAGVDSAALSSLHALFGVTREVLKKYGPRAEKFARVAIAVLNQVLRPFMTRWHGRLDGTGQIPAAQHQVFRDELRQVQKELLDRYIPVLTDLAGVEPLQG